jgi:hypothetical protein
MKNIPRVKVTDEAEKVIAELRALVWDISKSEKFL